MEWKCSIGYKAWCKFVALTLLQLFHFDGRQQEKPSLWWIRSQQRACVWCTVKHSSFRVLVHRAEWQEKFVLPLALYITTTPAWTPATTRTKKLELKCCWGSKTKEQYMILVFRNWSSFPRPIVLILFKQSSCFYCYTPKEAYFVSDVLLQFWKFCWFQCFWTAKKNTRQKGKGETRRQFEKSKLNILV